MPDLSTLDPTQPPGTQAVSLGDDRIRETRAAVINSFGVEHALTGEHQFLYGTTASRPAAGHAGRLFINLEIGEVQLDNGSIWTKLPTIPRAEVFIAGATSVANGGSYVIVATVNLPATLATIRATGEFGISTTNPQLLYKLVVDGADLPGERLFNFVGTSSINQPLHIHSFVGVGPGSGIHVVQLKIANFGVAAINVTDVILTAESM